MARPLLPAHGRENMAKPPDHPVSRTLAKNQRCAEIVRKPCRKEHDRKVFHAHRGEKNASFFTAKVSGTYVPHGKGFWQYPPRHATRYARLKTLVRLCITRA